MTRRAAIYCRISEDSQGDRLGVDRQEPPARQLARRLGWEVAEVFIDDDLSASRYGSKPRPAYERMLQAARDREISAIITLDADRLTRRPVENETVITLAESYGIALATAAGEIDLATAGGRLQFRLLGNVAAHESELKSERVRRKCAQMAQAGEDHGGIRSFGRDTDRSSLHPVEAALLATAAADVLAGRSLAAVCHDWNDQGITTTRGQPWSPTPLRRLLTNPRLYGARVHNGQVAKHDAFPPIVNRATWQQLHLLLTDPARARTPRAQYLLSGIASCWSCGRWLVGCPQRHARPFYGCRSSRGCGRVVIRTPSLDELVVEAVLLRLDGPGVDQAIARLEAATPAHEAILERIGEEETALSELVHARFVERTVDHSAYLTARAVLEGRVQTARRALGQQARTGVLRRLPTAPGALRVAWAAAAGDLGWQRAVIQAVIDRVVVGPGRPRRFDDARVLPPYGPVWRV